MYGAEKPSIPPDEDEALHARRLVAQKCLYGVDRNPMAVDLARLSLWLATLARDHEFTFLDHALKAGDSLVGLTRAEISGGALGRVEAGTAAVSRASIEQAVERRSRRPRGDPQRGRRRADRGAGGALCAGAGRERAGADRRRRGDRGLLFRRQAARRERRSGRRSRAGSRVRSRRIGTGCGEGRRVPRRTRAGGRFTGRSSFRRCSRGTIRASTRSSATRRSRERTRFPPLPGRATCRGFRRCTKARTATPISSLISSVGLLACFGMAAPSD